MWASGFLFWASTAGSVEVQRGCNYDERKIGKEGFMVKSEGRTDVHNCPPWTSTKVFPEELVDFHKVTVYANVSPAGVLKITEGKSCGNQ